MTTSELGRDDGPAEERLLEILADAIAQEQDAQARYRRGRDLGADDESRALFEQLIRDEEGHERLLVARYTAVKKRLGLKMGPAGDAEAEGT